jgi:hypothetical protein
MEIFYTIAFILFSFLYGCVVALDFFILRKIKSKKELDKADLKMLGKYKQIKGSPLFYIFPVIMAGLGVVFDIPVWTLLAAFWLYSRLNLIKVL